MGVGGQRHAPAALPPGRARYPLYKRLGGLQGRSGRVGKISSPTGIRSLDCPVPSELLYRLRYPGINTRNISWDKGGRWIVVTTLPPSYADCLEIWRSQIPWTLGASPGLYGNCFNFFYHNLSTHSRISIKTILPLFPHISRHFHIDSKRKAVFWTAVDIFSIYYQLVAWRSALNTSMLHQTVWHLSF